MCLDATAYLRAALPSALLVGLCLLQAFGYRLRRVIATFYFPKVRPALPSPPLHTPSPPHAIFEGGHPLSTVIIIDPLSLAPAREEADLVLLQ